MWAIKTVHSSGALFLCVWWGWVITIAQHGVNWWAPLPPNKPSCRAADGRWDSPWISKRPNHLWLSSPLQLCCLLQEVSQWDCAPNLTLFFSFGATTGNQMPSLCTLWRRVWLQFLVLGQVCTAVRHSTTLLWCSVRSIHLHVLMSTKLLFSFSQSLTTIINAPFQKASPIPPHMGDFPAHGQFPYTLFYIPGRK